MTNPFESEHGAANRDELETLVALTDTLLADVTPDVMHRIEVVGDQGALLVIAGQEITQYEDGETVVEDMLMFRLLPIDDDGSILEDEEPFFTLTLDVDGVSHEFPPSLNPLIPGIMLVEDIERAVDRIVAANGVLQTDKGLYIADYLSRFAEKSILGSEVDWRAIEELPGDQNTFNLAWNFVIANSPTGIISREAQFTHEIEDTGDHYEVTAYATELTNPEAAHLFEGLARISLSRDAIPENMPLDMIWVEHTGDPGHRLYTPTEALDYVLGQPDEELSEEDKAYVIELRRGLGELGVSGAVIGEYSAILLHQIFGDFKEQ